MRTQQSSLSHLVKILSDGKYHDGTTIGETLNITRSAVWKAMKKLEAYGIDVDSIKGKGYALPEPLILLDKKLIQKKLTNKNIDIQIVEEIDTTHDFKNFLDKNKTPSICLAESQTQGKGRMGRNWHSPFGQNLYFSCLYTFEKDISELAGLSLVVGLAVIKTLKKYDFPESPLIKWPNDVIYQYQKLAGTLIEVKAETHDSCRTIISIGVNVNMLKNDDTHKNISQLWTSLRSILGNYIDRNDLCAELMNNLLDYLKQFEQTGLVYFIPEWKTVDALFNKPITLNNANQKIHGIAKGINSQGNLLLKLEDGKLQAFSSGDTTVVKNKTAFKSKA